MPLAAAAAAKRVRYSVAATEEFAADSPPLKESVAWEAADLPLVISKVFLMFKKDRKIGL